MQRSPSEPAFYVGVMLTSPGAPSQAQIEAAVEQTFVSWVAHALDLELMPAQLLTQVEYVANKIWVNSSLTLVAG